MRIIVCIKSIPDTESNLRSLGKEIDTRNISFVTSPFDEYAVEEAVKLAENHNGSVTSLCLGAKSSEEVIRKTIASGADKGIHLRCDKELRDPFQVALTLAMEIKHREYDLIFFGRESGDNNNSLVGSMVASLLGIPSVTCVVKLDLNHNQALVKRENGNTLELIETSLPCVLTAQKGLNEPRFCSLKSIMAAKDAEIETIEPFIYPAFSELTDLRMPDERPPGNIIGKGVEAIPELVRLLGQEAGVL